MNRATMLRLLSLIFYLILCSFALAQADLSALGSPPSRSNQSETITAKAYGATCDGLADDTKALSAWIAAINGSMAASVVAELGAGNCQIGSSTLPSGLIITRDNVTIEGLGGTITVTGASPMKEVFQSADHSRIHYKNISFVGNSVGNVYAYGGAIAFTNTTVDIQDLLVEDCSFKNFKGDYWIYVQTLSPFTASIQNVKVNRNVFLSQNGNARGPTKIGINSSFVLVYGVGHDGSNNPTPNSFVKSVQITNNHMRADYIKTGVQAFHNVQDVVISGNQIYNNGQLGGIFNDVGSYAIMTYENESPSTTLYSAHAIIENNYIFNARDNCIYMAGQWTNSLVKGNICEHQTSIATATLPKGGISLNGTVGTTVTGNRLSNIAADGITLIAPSTMDSEWVIANNYVSARLGGIRLLNSGNNAGKITVANNTVANIAGAVGILVRVFRRATYAYLKIDSNNIQKGSYGILFLSDSASRKLSNVSVSHNLVDSPTRHGIDISQLASRSTVQLADNLVRRVPSSARSPRTISARSRYF
ncbi:right-handed parallel beta-helix repeat-containing protein [Bradyrhizobium sp. DASA03120]|uniref:right-handed parallel beta-helix repeat-containing protein n=1 Tax=Bradyrhizobium sp. SMVTL-02 TaxID=3395917 RepID=UPI003F6EDC3A